MTKALLCILFCILVTGAKCQRGEEEESGSSWDRFIEIWSNFYNSMRDVLRKAWRDFTDEIKARTADFRGWTEEAWDSFKQKMREWVNERDDINEKEKNELRKYIERLQMPPEEDEKDRK